MKTIICCILLASIALVGGQITRPKEQSCDDDINPLYKCARISEHCSNGFIERCLNLSDNLENRQMTFFPNCFGHTNEYEANSLMNQFISLIPGFTDNCTNLAIPLMCFGLYPKCFGDHYRLAPCPEFCDKFVAECISPGVPLPWNCDQLFRSGPCVNNTNAGICLKPTNNTSLSPKPPPTDKSNPKSPSTKYHGFVTCTNKTLPVCTKIRPSKCALIRKSASEKAFTKGFYFGKF